jgi:hypothetical protein
MKPLRPARPVPPKWTAYAAEMARRGLTQEQARALYHEVLAAPAWLNDLYVVHVREQDDGVTHLSIRRQDRGPARDWRHFQQIKNQLCGAEREGVELYPAESRVVDTVNQFHLWVMPLGVSVACGFPAGLRSDALPVDPAGFPTQQRPGAVG